MRTRPYFLHESVKLPGRCLECQRWGPRLRLVEMQQDQVNLSLNSCFLVWILVLMTWFKNGLQQEWTYVLSAQRGYWTLKVPLSAFTRLQFREQTFCGCLLSFWNLISYSINSFTFTFAPTPSTCTSFFTFIFFFAHSHPSTSPFYFISDKIECLSLLYTCAQTQKTGCVGMRLQQIWRRFRAADVFAFFSYYIFKSRKFLPGALRNSHLASFQVRSALQPVPGCVIIIPFLSSNSDWHVQKEHYLKIIPHWGHFLLEVLCISKWT